MKKYFFFIFTASFCFIAYNVFTNAGGPVTGVAGDPPFGETCAAAGCHTGSALNSGGGTTKIICKDSIGNTVVSYDPNHTYTITLSVTEGVKTRYGFEAIVLKGSGTAASGIGTIVLTDLVKTQLFGGSKKYIMHKLAGIDFAGTTGTWLFNWKAPTANNGTATVYAAFNATNKNGNETGDKVYTATLDLTGNGPLVGIKSPDPIVKFKVYPNPASSNLYFDLYEKSTIEIYNMKGEVIRSCGFYCGVANIDINDLSPGVYLARITSVSNTNACKFIKQ